MDNKETTFWNCLKENKIEIPIIQRDYAQGRLGKEYIRKNFLTSLKAALDGERIKLDFVYGSINDNTLKPLDGQQRLTTLWLLHWFIALKAKKLDEAGEILSRFTYETRISSREFCKNLCKASNFDDYKEGSVVNYIMMRTWFFEAWRQDPTIQSMLRMIKGSSVSDKKGNDITDGLEEVFKDSDDSEFSKYWEKLTSADAPIVFYLQPLEYFGLSDDLYIKMNARGKQLTAFENFKADLIGYIRDQANNDNRWEGLLDPKDGIPILLDNDWTDLFWKNQKGHKIDEIFLAFINRFFWNELFMAKSIDGDKDTFLLQLGEGKIGEEMVTNREQYNLSYVYLNKDDSTEYTDFAPYRFKDKEVPFESIENLKTVLNRYVKFNKGVPGQSWANDFKFIPEYEEKDGGIVVSSINQVQRVAFFAVCKYLKEGEADEESFKRWMRVVWNLISGYDEIGPQIRSTSAMRTAMMKIGSLRSHHVYEDLAYANLVTGSISDFDERWNEEIVKAKKIVEDNTCEEVIIKAENWGFFSGSIRFLFTNAEGDVNWNDFPTKWRNAQRYFCEERGGRSVMGENYDSAQLLKAVISRIPSSDFEKILKWKHRFANTDAIWMFYLLNLNGNIRYAINKILMGTDSIIKLSEQNESEEERYIYLLSNTGLLDYIQDKNPSAWWIRPYHGHIAIYPSSTGIFLDAEKRDQFLSYHSGITVDENAIVPNTDLLFGSDINFQYKGRNFRWTENDSIYLMNGNDPCIKDATKEETDNDRYYCFRTKNKDEEAIVNELDNILNKANAI